MNQIVTSEKTPYYYFFIKEKEYNLFGLQHDGVYYWQLIRFALLKSITVKNLHVAGKSTKRNYKDEIAGAFKESKRMQHLFNSAEQADVIRIRPCVTVSKEGTLDDHQYDYVSLNCSFFDLYTLGNYCNIPQCVKYDMACAEKKLILWKLKRKVFGGNSILNEQSLILKAFLEDVNKMYGMCFDVEELKRQISYSVHCHKYYVEEFNKVFSIVKPKLIFVYPHYDEHMFAAMEAARQIGIKSIEMQHGRINAHEAYWYEDQTPIGKVLPDYFFTYGEWWNEKIQMPYFCKPIAVGNPYLESQLELYPRKNHLVGTTITVLSNTQNGKVLSEFIYELRDFIIDNNISILYKLHPNERNSWKEEYPLLHQLPNTRIVDDNTSAYNLLAESNIAIGINSTLFYEALAYDGIRLFIYTIGDYEGMKPLIESGVAEPVISSNDLKAKIALKSTTEVINNAVFWKRESEKNMVKQVNTILQDGEIYGNEQKQ